MWPYRPAGTARFPTARRLATARLGLDFLTARAFSKKHLKWELLTGGLERGDSSTGSITRGNHQGKSQAQGLGELGARDPADARPGIPGPEGRSGRQGGRAAELRPDLRR